MEIPRLLEVAGSFLWESKANAREERIQIHVNSFHLRWPWTSLWSCQMHWGWRDGSVMCCTILSLPPSSQGLLEGFVDVKGASHYSGSPGKLRTLLRDGYSLFSLGLSPGSSSPPPKILPSYALLSVCPAIPCPILLCSLPVGLAIHPNFVSSRRGLVYHNLFCSESITSGVVVVHTPQTPSMDDQGCGLFMAPHRMGQDIGGGTPSPVLCMYSPL